MQETRIAPKRSARSLKHRRRVMGDGIRFVGLDVHKRQTVVALADSGREGEGRHYGAVETDRSTIEKLARKVASGAEPPRFCYEAGPCGDGTLACVERLRHVRS